MVTWFHCFWACGEAEHHGGEQVGEQSWSPHGEWEAGRDLEGPGTRYVLQGHTLVTHLPQTDPPPNNATKL
jgi:hypothetical protein